MTTNVKLERINLDPTLQHRERAKDQPGYADPELVERYSDFVKAGGKLPPVKLIREGQNLWLYDGFSTLQAQVKNNKTHVAAEITDGTREDALRESWKANATHGKQRDLGDAKNVLRSMFAADRALIRKSGADLAKITGLSERWCREVRKQLVEEEGFRQSAETSPGTDPAPEEGRPPRGQRGATPRGGRPPGPSRREASDGEAQGNGRRKKKKGNGSGQSQGAQVDKAGQPVPPEMRAVFAEPLIEGIVQGIQEMVDALRATEEWAHYVHRATAMQALGAAIEAVEAGIPYGVCPACNGQRCERCRQAGYLPESQYQELKSQLELESSNA